VAWLVGLALVVPALSGRSATASEVVARFSGLAAGVLAVLVAAGSLLAWRILGSWGALVDTDYGRLLLLKVGAAAVAVLIAAWNRYVLVPRLRGSSRGEERSAGGRLVARSTAVEAAVVTAVVLVTGFLVDTSPEGAPAAAATAATAGQDSSDPGTRTATLGDVRVRASIAPLAPGRTTVRIDLEHPSGGPAVGVESLSARLTSDGAPLGDIPLTFVAEGSYTSEVVLPAPGTWRLQVSVRRSEFVNPVTTLEFTVPGG
jgi:copper transport protein